MCGFAQNLGRAECIHGINSSKYINGVYKPVRPYCTEHSRLTLAKRHAQFAACFSNSFTTTTCIRKQTKTVIHSK